MFDNRVKTEYIHSTHLTGRQVLLPVLVKPPVPIAFGHTGHQNRAIKTLRHGGIAEQRDPSVVPIFLPTKLRVQSDATCAQCAAAVGKDAPRAFSSVICFPIPISFGF